MKSLKIFISLKFCADVLGLIVAGCGNNQRRLGEKKTVPGFSSGVFSHAGRVTILLLASAGRQVAGSPDSEESLDAAWVSCCASGGGILSFFSANLAVFLPYASLGFLGQSVCGRSADGEAGNHLLLVSFVWCGATCSTSATRRRRW